MQDAQVILLNDYRWCEGIPWTDFLNLLEGYTVKFPTPKNHFAQDEVIDTSNNVPILATSAAKLEYQRSHPNYLEETGMMDKWWKYYKFTHVFGTVLVTFSLVRIVSCD